MKRRTLLLFSIVALSTLALAGCIPTSEATMTETAEFDMTAAFQVSGLVNLDISSSNGQIRVEGQDTTTVSVVATLRSRGTTEAEAQERVEQIEINMTQEDNRVLLEYRSADQPADVRRYSGVDFSVIVPLTADVEVDTSNGAITVRGIQGEFDLDTSNGAVDLDNLVGDINVDTSNGKITVDNVQGILNLETSNGAIDLDDVEATIDARTSNGAIEFSGILAGDNHRLRTSNGRINVELQPDASIEIDAETSSGSISTTLPLVGDTDGKAWSATLNPPANTTLDLRTSNGSIRIDGQI